MLISGRVPSPFTHIWASSCGFRPFDPGIIKYIKDLLLVMKQKNSNILTSILTIFSLWAVFLLQLVVRIKAIKGDYPLYTAIFATLMILITVFAAVFRGKAPRKKNSFNLPMLISWILMCLAMLYSDIVVFKVYWFLSLILLVLFTGLFVVFNSYTGEMRDRLWELFLIAVEAAFAGATIFCFLFRPYTAGIRYSGLSANPNVYAMFLISVWICMTTRLDFIINKGKNTLMALIPGIEAGCALFFLYMTGARTSFLAICSVSFVWFIFRLYYSRKERKPMFRYIVTAVCGLIPAAAMSYFILSTLPGIVNHPVTFERDRLFTALEYDSSVCYAAEADADVRSYAAAGSDAGNGSDADVSSVIAAGSDAGNGSDADVSSVTAAGSDADNGSAADSPVQDAADGSDDTSLIGRIHKIVNGHTSLDDILNGRVSIYKSYMKKINNSGHRKYNKKVNGANATHAHNNIIQMAYTYGKPAGIMYVIVLLLSVFFSIRLYIVNHNRRKMAVLPMLIVAGFLVTSMTECIMLPMQSLLAFSYYLAVGELINTKYCYKSN